MPQPTLSEAAELNFGVKLCRGHRCSSESEACSGRTLGDLPFGPRLVSPPPQVDRASQRHNPPAAHTPASRPPPARPPRSGGSTLSIARRALPRNDSNGSADPLSVSANGLGCCADPMDVWTQPWHRHVPRGRPRSCAKAPAPATPWQGRDEGAFQGAPPLRPAEEATSDLRRGHLFLPADASRRGAP